MQSAFSFRFPIRIHAVCGRIRYPDDEHRDVIRTDIRLSYSEAGAGAPLFLLHGNGEDRGFFEAQISAFSSVRRVIAVDTRGHGQSPRGTTPFTLAQFARDLAALMDELRITRADLLGYSDGGNIALLFALGYPDRVNSLVLSGANLFPAGLKLGVWMDVQVRYALYSVAPFSPDALRKRELFGLMARQPHIRPKALAAVAVPTLVVAGTKDVIRPRHTRLIARSLPGGRLLLLPGGHAVARENPKAFNEGVTAFWTESHTAKAVAQGGGHSKKNP
jgi:pimeloyl-ACP methyl ester carboxylesterase